MSETKKENLMNAIVLHGPGDYTLEQVPVPVPGRNEVLVEIKSIAICGSDPGIFNGNVLKDGWPPRYPFIAGHEFAGTVVGLGAGVRQFKTGNRVAGEAHCGCGVCDMCKQGYYNLCQNYGHSGHRHYGHASEGCYAQYQVYDVKSLTLLPENVSYDEGAMIDTGGVGFNAVRLCGIEPGGWTLIIGPGPMGIILMEIAKAMGSKTIIVGYHDEQRLAFARKLGADYALETTEYTNIIDEIRKITDGRGAHQSFDCAGAGDSLDVAIQSTRSNGKTGIIAYPKHPVLQETLYYIVKNQLHVQGVRANPNCSKPLLELISSGAVDVSSMITHSFRLEELEAAFDTFTNHKDGAIKVVIHPNE